MPGSVRKTLAVGGRWRWEGARMGYPDAGASIALECGGRWRVRDAGVGEEARIGSMTMAIPLRWRGWWILHDKNFGSRKISFSLQNAFPGSIVNQERKTLQT